MSQRRPDRILGPQHAMFWQWCEKGELRIPRCTACAKLVWPVIRLCDGCGGANFGWERMSGRAKVVSWCTFVQDYYKGTLPVPYDSILLELEEGPLFMSIPDGFEEREIRSGLPVELQFRECHDSTGPFLLPVFALAETDAP